MKEEQLIFIVSQPRAGSTYLQNILSNNNEVNTCSEPWIMLNFVNYFKPDLLSARFNNKLTKKAFQYYIKNQYIDFDTKQKEFLLSLYEPLIENHKFVIDKTPRYWMILNELISYFPKSKIIVIRRNPIDVLKSMIITWNIQTIERFNEYRDDILKAPFVIDKFIDNNKTNHNLTVIEYEELIINKSKYTKELYNKLGLLYTHNVLDTSKNEKYKGHFGDPYQNKTVKKKRELNGLLKDFLSGYAFYLGEDYFTKHNYKLENLKKTNSFQYFLDLGYNRKIVSLKSVKREALLLIKKKLVYFKK